MDGTEKLLKETVAELDRLLRAQNVIGEPITHGNVTVAPLVSFAFGYGAGGGGANGESGSGTGGGGGIKPQAVLIIDGDGARVEPIRSGKSTMADAIASVAATIAETAGNRKKGKPGKKEPADAA